MSLDRRSLRAWLRWAPPVAWMAFIMWLSTDTFSAANTAHVLDPSLSRLAPWLTPAQIDAVHFAVRKSAHMTEYGVLAWLWFRVLSRDAGESARRAAAWVFQISVLWAATDELHQATTLARTGSVRDVVIDAAGAALALGMLLALRASASVAWRSRTSVSAAGLLLILLAPLAAGCAPATPAPAAWLGPARMV